MRDLVGVRHKGHGYLARRHPEFKDAIPQAGVISKVDEIDTVRQPSGVANWISIMTYLPNNMIGDLRVRIEECDQFFYLVEDKP